MWFAYSAFSGKQFYNEGDWYNEYQVKKVAAKRWRQVNLLLDSENREEALEAWKKIKASHLIISRRISGLDFDKPYLGKVVFKNQDIKVVSKP